MLPRFSVTDQRQTAIKRIVLCCGCLGLSFLAIAWFGLHQRLQASENILPDRQVHAAPTKIQPKLVGSYGKLPLSFEANEGQSVARVRFLARGDGATASNPGTPAGTYPLTVTGCTGSGSTALSHSVALTLTVSWSMLGAVNRCSAPICGGGAPYQPPPGAAESNKTGPRSRSEFIRLGETKTSAAGTSLGGE